MVIQNPDLIRVQNIPQDFIIITKSTEIDWLRNKYSIRQQFNYLFIKIDDNDIVSIYGSYGHSDVSEIYHVLGELIKI